MNNGTKSPGGIGDGDRDRASTEPTVSGTAATSPPVPKPVLEPGELNPEPQPVRKFNSLPVYIVLCVALLVLAVFAMLGTRSKPRPVAENPAEQPASVDTDALRRRAERLEAAQTARPVIDRERPRELPPRLPPPKETEARSPGPTPVIVGGFHNTPPRLAGGRGADESSVAGIGPSVGSAPASYQGGLGAADQAVAVGSGGAGGEGGAAGEHHELYGDRQAETFLADTSGRAPGGAYLASTRTAPLTRYELKASTRIPAILQTEINSDLPGFITALVRRDVYDSVRGEYLLIPRGSRLYGEYNHRVVWGEQRVLMAWTRIIFPDGSSLDLEGMPGADGLGASGVRDQVNNHFVRLYGSSLLLAVVNAGFQISQNTNGGGESGVFTRNADASQVAAAAVAQELARTSNQVLRRNLNISPTLRVRVGKLLAVEVTRDLAFAEPYREMGPVVP